MSTSNFKGIVKLTEEQYEELSTNNTLTTSSGTTITYDPTSTLYITPNIPSELTLINKDNQFTVGQTINGNLTVNGDIIRSGSSYETHAEEIYSTKDYIYLREGAVSGLTSGQYSGLEFINYDGTNNGRLVIDNTGTVRVGDVGEERPLAVRGESPIDGGIAIWNNDTKTFDTNNTYTYNNLVIKSNLNNYVDLTSSQTISGIKEFSNVIKSTRRRWVSDTSEFLITSDSFDFGFDNLLIDTIQTQTGAFSGEFSSGNIVYGDFIIPLKDLRDNVLIGREMTISDTSNSSRYNIVIGNLSNYSTSRDPSVYGSRNIVISTQQNNGRDSVVSGEASIAIGYNTRITGDNSIQLGTGTNNTSNTFQVWNYALLDGSTGKIPSDRLDINLDNYATISDLSNYLNKSSTSTDGTSTITLSNSDGQLTISVNVDNLQKYYKYIQKNNVIETFNSGTTSLPKVGNVLGDGLVASQLALSDGTSYMQGCVNEMNNAFIGAIDYYSEELFLLVGKFSESTPISSILSNPGIYGISSDIYFGNMNNSYLSIMNDNVIISSNAYLDSVSDNNKIPKMSDIPTININGVAQTTLNFDSDPQTQIDNKFDKTGGTITGDTNIVNGQGLVLTPASAGSTYYAFKFYAQGDDVFVEKQKVEGGADYQKLLPLDSSLSTTSENAVQNRAITTAINDILARLEALENSSTT